MDYYFSQHKRRVTLANFNLYINEAYHPDRIMAEHDFFYLTEGGWTVGQNGESYEVFPDDVIIFPAKMHHYGVSATLPRTRTIFIHSTPAQFDGCLSSAPGFIKLGTRISCRGYEKPKKLFGDIAFLFWSDEPNKEMWIESLFNVLLCELSKIEREKSKYSPNGLIDEMLHLIYSNPQKFYMIEELAGIFKISGKTVSNLFIKHTGKPVHKYQMSLKIDMIKSKFAVEPNVKIKDVSEEYGFSDEFHFSRVFKDFTGISPKLFKKTSSAYPRNHSKSTIRESI